MQTVHKNNKSSPDYPSYRQSERGNILFIILIGAVLFGALSYTVSGMLRSSGGSDLSREKIKLYAGEIVDYGRKMRQAVKITKITNNCDNTGVSFDNNVVSGYAHSPAVDDSCKIFLGTDSGIQWASPPFAYNGGTEWVITGANIVSGIGTSSPDLTLILQNVNSDICTEINNISGHSSLGTDSDIAFTQFTGTYASTETIDSADSKPYGCLNYVNSGNNYFFYQVLIAR